MNVRIEWVKKITLLIKSKAATLKTFLNPIWCFGSVKTAGHLFHPCSSFKKALESWFCWSFCSIFSSASTGYWLGSCDAVRVESKVHKLIRRRITKDGINNWMWDPLSQSSILFVVGWERCSRRTKRCDVLRFFRFSPCSLVEKRRERESCVFDASLVPLPENTKKGGKRRKRWYRCLW